MKRLGNIAVIAVGALAASQALADVPVSKGCYERDYSDAHLAKHPDQVVDKIGLKIFVNDYQETVATMQVTFANQGHAARAGQGGAVMEQFLFCYDDGGQVWCGVECDGGRFEVTRDDSDVLVFRTKYLMVGDTDECGGALDLAEVPRQMVSYRLNRVVGPACDVN